METILYEKEFGIPVYETGADGRLNPHSLFNFLQDIASEHAVRLRFGKDDLLKENRFWVLSRIVADITFWPEWEQKIIISTWPRGTDKLFAIRDFEVYFPDGRHIASASSSWLIVDRTTRRVQRPDDILSRFNTDLPAGKSPGRNAGKLEPLPAEVEKSNPFRVRMSDIDANMHTNNVAYIRWITDTYDPGFRMANLPESVEVNYLAESRWNDEIVIDTAADKNSQSIYNHSVTRTVDNTELCRVRIGWRNCRL